MIPLSEAILLGAMMRPPAFGPLKYPKASCSLQAGLDAVGHEMGRYIYPAVVKIWPWLNRNVECPWCVREHAVYNVIGLCLNDRAKWSRQKIAKWVATIEPVGVNTTQTSQAQEVGK
jgi:hypothetical protein